MTNEPVAHPAPWNLHVLGYVDDVLAAETERLGKKRLLVLDPFGGIGRIHDLPHDTVTVELEQEWADQGADRGESWIGDATDMHWFRRNSFHALATSATFGNRMGDHHDANDAHKLCGGGGCDKCHWTGLSHRRTYKHYLGRDLSDNNSGAMHWGREYRRLHTVFLLEAMRVTKPGGPIIVNMANHFKTFKKGEDAIEQRVCEWWIFTMIKLGMNVDEIRRIHTSKYRFGAHRETRTKGELVIVMRNPEVPKQFINFDAA